MSGDPDDVELSTDDKRTLKELLSDYRDSSVTRRAAMGGTAAILGGAAFGAGRVTADTPDGSPGVMGQENDRLDAWIDQADANSVDTEHAGNVTLGSGYDSLEAAVNNTNEGIIFVDGAFTVDNPPIVLDPGVSLWSQPRARDGTAGGYIEAGGTATNLIEVTGGGQGTPSFGGVHNIQLEGKSNVTNLIEVGLDARSVKFRGNMMYNADYAFAIRGQGVKIIDCEMNDQSEYGINFLTSNIRDVTVRDSNFEGFTQGFAKFDPDIGYAGAIRFHNCRFSCYNTEGTNAPMYLSIGDKGNREFAVVINECVFFEFPVDEVPINVNSGSYPEVNGTIKITNNLFNGNDRDTDTDTGRRALQVEGPVEDLIVRNNHTEHFQGPEILNVKNSKSTLEIGGNTGQAVFENRGNVSIADQGTISHGLQNAPEYINLTASRAGHIASEGSIDGSDIEVRLWDEAGNAITSAETVYWEARYV